VSYISPKIHENTHTLVMKYRGNRTIPPYGVMCIKENELRRFSWKEVGGGPYEEFGFLNEAMLPIVVNTEAPLTNEQMGVVQQTSGAFLVRVKDRQAYPHDIPRSGARCHFVDDSFEMEFGYGGDYVVVKNLGVRKSAGEDGVSLCLVQLGRETRQHILVSVNQAIPPREGNSLAYGSGKVVDIVDATTPGWGGRDELVVTDEIAWVYNWTKGEVGGDSDAYVMAVRMLGRWVAIAEDCYNTTEGPMPIFGGFLNKPPSLITSSLRQRVVPAIKEAENARLAEKNSTTLTNFDIASSTNSFFAESSVSLTPTVGRLFTWTPAIITHPVRGRQGPFEFSLSRRLPDGLSLDRTSGTIKGTLVREYTDYKCSLSATDQQNYTDTIQMTISTKVEGVRVSPPTNLSLTVGSAATKTWTATGGVQPYTFSIDNVPAGMSFNTKTGVLSGTPSGAGTTSCTVTVQSSVQTAAYQVDVSSAAVNLVALA